VVGQNQQLVRLDYEDVQPPTPDVEAKVLEAFETHLGLGDLVLIPDYAKGAVTPSLMREVVRRAHERGLSIVVDPRPQHRDCYVGCDYLTPNWKEARTLLGLPDAEATAESVQEVSRALAGEL